MPGRNYADTKIREDVTIVDFDIDVNIENNYKILTHITFKDRDGNEKQDTIVSTIPELFSKGGILSSDEMKSAIMYTRTIRDDINRIATMAVSKKEENEFELVISNRPADFLRASTGQAWTSCMGFRQYPGASGNNRTLLTKMNLGGYVAYLAGNEFDNGWKARVIITPVMDEPNEKHPSGRVTNMFRVDEMYGIKAYFVILRSALGIILREHGYNAPDSYDIRDHGGRGVSTYIFNEGQCRGGYTTTTTRRGGSCGNGEPGAFGGTLFSNITREMWAKSYEKCIERVLAGY